MKNKKNYMVRSKFERTSEANSVVVDINMLSKMVGFDPKTDNPVLDIIGFGKEIKIALGNCKKKDFRMVVSWEKKITNKKSKGK